MGGIELTLAEDIMITNILLAGAITIIFFLLFVYVRQMPKRVKHVGIEFHDEKSLQERKLQINQLYSLLFKSVTEGSIPALKDTIQQLKAIKSWDRNNEIIVNSMKRAYKADRRDIIKLLLKQKAAVPEDAVTFAVINENPTEANWVTETIRKMQTSGTWDPLSTAAADALKTAYEENKEEAIIAILNNGVKVTTKCLLYAVKSCNSAVVKMTINQMKKSRQWDTNAEFASKALTEAVRRTNKYVVDILLKENIKVTEECLQYAVITAHVDTLRTIIIHLQSQMAWDPESEGIINLIKYAHNPEIVDAFLCNGVNAIKMLKLATLYCDGFVVDIIIKKLKTSGQWVPAYWANSSVLEKAYQRNISEVINVFIKHGINITSKHLYWSAKYNNMDLLNKTIKYFKYKKRWNPESYITTLKQAYKENQGDVILLMMKENVFITPECFHLAVKHSDATVMKATIQQLKSTSRWNPKKVSGALEVAFKLRRDDIIKLLIDERVPLTLQCLASTEENGETMELWKSKPLPHGTDDSTAVINFQNAQQLRSLLDFHLNDKIVHKCLICQAILKHICSILEQQEAGNFVQIYTAYRPEERWKPIIVLLEKEVSIGKWDTFFGIDRFRRRFDFVSLEAAKVMNDEEVQKDLLNMKEMNSIRESILSSNLPEKHSNITLISSCPYRSKQGGTKRVKETCIVVHCLLKGFIPFGEEPFPQAINGVPVDVREGYCVFGMNPREEHEMEIDQSADVFYAQAHVAQSGQIPNIRTPLPGPSSMMGPSERPVALHHLAQIGPLSTNYNQHLLIGTGIGPSCGIGRGTLGGFAKAQDGTIGFLTCAHVTTLPHRPGTMMSQPADGDLPEPGDTRAHVCGEVTRHVFDPGTSTRGGVDAAFVKITERNRMPKGGSFIAVAQEQTSSAGFDVGQPPKFNSGKILKINQITDNMKRMFLIKYGSQTGLTMGLVNQNGTYGQHLTDPLQLPNGQKFRFYDQIEVLSLGGLFTRFFDLGDSGSLVFLPLEAGLHCVGLAIGKTHYGSCIVTPIENVLDRLGVEILDFTSENDTAT